VGLLQNLCKATAGVEQVSNVEPVIGSPNRRGYPCDLKMSYVGNSTMRAACGTTGVR
jgi:hypothetical protein